MRFLRHLGLRAVQRVSAARAQQRRQGRRTASFYNRCGGEAKRTVGHTVNTILEYSSGPQRPTCIGVRSAAMDGGTQPGGTDAIDPAGTHVQKLFHNFLQEYRAEGDTELDEPVYVRWLRELKTAERTTLYVEFSHLLECVPGAAGEA